MAVVLLSVLRDYWKNVSEWVLGSSSSKPKVQNVNSSGTEIFTSANPGNIKVIGQKNTDGTTAEALSFVLDNNSRPVIRVVDAAPFAYDNNVDKIKVKDDIVLAKLDEIDQKINAIKNTDGIKKITDNVNVALTGSNAPKSGQKNVATAGTKVALGGDQEYKKINIIAKSTNTGDIYVGDNTVTSTSGGILPPGGFMSLEFVNTNEVYIDAFVSGEGVSWIGVV